MSNFETWLEYRGITKPCDHCCGLGVIVYGSTATWRGGIGGATMTNDVCNKCWGSGDANRPWPSHREFYEMKKKLLREKASNP